MMLDVDIITLIIQEENKRKQLEETEDYRETVVVHDYPMDIEDTKEPDEKPKRGVIVIDL